MIKNWLIPLISAFVLSFIFFVASLTTNSVETSIYRASISFLYGLLGGLVILVLYKLVTLELKQKDADIADKKVSVKQTNDQIEETASIVKNLMKE
ncbi:hypothetical protein FLK61_32450 [Paenalkalicoccus suaedae]|uniref:Uncharacterized protein n=1 Tax=Paenalkalicoccus suaedae TaxID=2592382 RepID=A0A859FDH2_9BACI|nr:hypothetical protein [Paenalkalicoccus suaedae]QKS71413.1 hypothetical protein FLK61_32450 [Paenalkalicoccus suaedae]